MSSSDHAPDSNRLRPQIPTLPAEVVHVWVVSLTVPDSMVASLGDLLSPDERERASRFRFERDTRRFTIARGASRSILAGYLGSEAHDLRFRYSAHGKPSLDEPAEDFRFNVSHSNDRALLAVVRSREIGVDIEYMRPDVETDKLAERFFSLREREVLRAIPAGERLAAFYQGWTCKEAFLKAHGSGFSRNLSSFDVELATNLPARLLGTRPDQAEARRWTLRKLEVSSGYAAALAVEGTISDLSQFRYGDTGSVAVSTAPNLSDHS